MEVDFGLSQNLIGHTKEVRCVAALSETRIASGGKDGKDVPLASCRSKRDKDKCKHCGRSGHKSNECLRDPGISKEEKVKRFEKFKKQKQAKGTWRESGGRTAQEVALHTSSDDDGETLAAAIEQTLGVDARSVHKTRRTMQGASVLRFDGIDVRFETTAADGALVVAVGPPGETDGGNG